MKGLYSNRGYFRSDNHMSCPWWCCIRSKFASNAIPISVNQALLGSFSIDDGNGSENISFKMNSRFFNLCRFYSNLLKMASVGEFPWG